MEYMYKEQVEMCKKVTGVLEIVGEFEDVKWSCTNEGLEFKVYENKYDYRKIGYKWNKDTDVCIYAQAILNNIQEQELVIASSLERYFIDLIDEAELENIYIYDSIITDGDIEVYIEDIEEWSYKDGVITITDDCETIEIDIVNDEMRLLE